MKQKKDNTQDKIKLIQAMLKNPYAKYALVFFGGILALFIGGKLMRFFAGLIMDFKMLKVAIQS
jgi:hypothetical protein